MFNTIKKIFFLERPFQNKTQMSDDNLSVFQDTADAKIFDRPEASMIWGISGNVLFLTALLSLFLKILPGLSGFFALMVIYLSIPFFFVGLVSYSTSIKKYNKNEMLKFRRIVQAGGVINLLSLVYTMYLIDVLGLSFGG